MNKKIKLLVLPWIICNSNIFTKYKISNLLDDLITNQQFKVQFKEINKKTIQLKKPDLIKTTNLGDNFFLIIKNRIKYIISLDSINDIILYWYKIIIVFCQLNYETWNKSHWHKAILVSTYMFIMVIIKIMFIIHEMKKYKEETDNILFYLIRPENEEISSSNKIFIKFQTEKKSTAEFLSMVPTINGINIDENNK